ncbi:hypothetical protein ACOSQ2_030365 [Xanthoceras sorbifolium]
MTSVFRLSLDQLPEHAAAANLKTLADFSLKSTYDRGVNQQCLHLRGPPAAAAAGLPDRNTGAVKLADIFMVISDMLLLY